MFEENVGAIPAVKYHDMTELPPRHPDVLPSPVPDFIPHISTPDEALGRLDVAAGSPTPLVAAVPIVAIGGPTPAPVAPLPAVAPAVPVIPLVRYSVYVVVIFHGIDVIFHILDLAHYLAVRKFLFVYS